jgi:hypothetical protein
MAAPFIHGKQSPRFLNLYAGAVWDSEILIFNINIL